MSKELIVFKDDVSYLSESASFDLVTLDKEINRLTAMRDELKANLLREMEERGIIRLESDEVAVTYIQPADRESFDSKKFRADNPDLYDSYVKLTPVKPSLRIKVKENV